jgi:hypothetical protein
LADEITEPGACRVLARSAVGKGHDPDGGAALGLVIVAGGVCAAAGLLEVLQAAASKAARTASRLSPMRVCPVRLEVGMAASPELEKLISE